MKLSEAIREGAKLRPKTTEDHFANGRSCALGAAYEGATGRYDENFHVVYKTLWKLFGKTLRLHAPSPLRGERPDSVCNHIVSLNYKWTRERIATWVESVEQEAA